MMYLFIYLDIAGPLLALLFYIGKYKEKIQAGPKTFILYFLLLQLLINSWAKIVWLNGDNNIYVYQINALFSCVVVTLYISNELKKTGRPKLISALRVYSAVSYLVLLAMILSENTSSFNSLSYTFTGFTICVFCVVFYLNNLANLNEESLLGTSGFWAVTAFFFYYSVSFFIFLYYNIFTKMGMANFGILWAIHNFVLFISCFLLIIAAKYR